MRKKTESIPDCSCSETRRKMQSSVDVIGENGSGQAIDSFVSSLNQFGIRLELEDLLDRPKDLQNETLVITQSYINVPLDFGVT